MALAQTNRAVGSHDMNEHSSRSHSILTLVCRGKNRIDGTTTFGKYGNLFKKIGILRSVCIFKLCKSRYIYVYIIYIYI